MESVLVLRRRKGIDGSRNTGKRVKAVARVNMVGFGGWEQRKDADDDWSET